MDGSLAIYVSFDTLTFERKYFDDGQGNIEYSPRSTEEAIANLFKTSEATLDGYDIKLVVDDAPNYERIEREVLNSETRSEDRGIGHYEFWGDRGYDSRIVKWEEESGIEIGESDVLVHFEVVKH